MLCPLNRWLISRSADSGKAMPSWAVRHTERCRSCRSFAAFTAALPSRLSGDLQAHLAEVPGTLSRPHSADAPSSSVGRRTGIGFLLRPVPAAILVLVLAVGVFVFRGMRTGPPLTAERAKAAVAGLKELTAATENWPVFVRTAESSLEQERLILENAARSAYAFLQERLNIVIEKKNTSIS